MLFASIVASLVIATAHPARMQPDQSTQQPQTPPQVSQENLPEPEEVFEAYVEALGGREKMKEITSRRIDGRYVGRPFKFAARLTIWQEFPNKFHVKIQEPAGETIEIGFDGKQGWERQPGIGLRYMEGLRLIELRDSSDFWGEANYKERYVDWSVVGRSIFQGQKAVGIHVKGVSGREKMLIFSEETGLYLGSRTFTVHPETGEPAEFETVLKEYKDFDGIKFPTGLIQRFRGEENAAEFEYVRITMNPKEKHDFGPPAELRDKNPEQDAGG